MLEKPKKLNVPAHKQLTQLKIGLVGQIQTGKTSFVNQYVKQQFVPYYQPTLGVQTADKYLSLKGGTVHITFWDFSGKPDFAEIRNQFYSQCDKIFIFTDLSNKVSVDGVDNWVKEIKEGQATCPLYVIGNKSDSKSVATDMSQLAKNNGCKYYQISAKLNEGIKEMMEKVSSETK